MLWKLLAFVVSRPGVADWLIWRARRTPYRHLDGYMNRWWLFNPYGWPAGGKAARFPWLPSIRIHHILRADNDQHLHDHPWNARTIILRGWYVEQRLLSIPWAKEAVESIQRRVGDTAPLVFEQYHKISFVPNGGVWTLFITWKYQGDWGFLVNGRKIPWKQYLLGARQ